MAKAKGRNPFIWIVMILLFVGLLGFGTGGLGGNIRTLGTVGEKDVSIAGYQNALNQQIRAFEAQTGQRITLQQAREFGIDQAVLQQLILQRTLDNEATQLGISVGDARVQTEVLRIPAFQNLQGQFDRDGYRLALQRMGQTEAGFESDIRDEISRTLLQGAVIGGVPAPDAYANTVVQFIGETRDLTYAAVTADDLATPVPGPTDAVLQTFYEANPDSFTAPETRAISYAWITPEMIAGEMVIDDQMLQDLYQQRINDFVRPERRLVERLVFADDAAATAAKARLDDASSDFDALVAERGLTLNDVDLGDVAQSDLGAAGDAVFAATPGDVVGPFASDLGPALFRMNAILAAEEVSFDEAAPDLQAELAASQAARQIAAQAEQINDLIAGGATLEDIVERSDLQLGQINWSPDVQDGIAAYDTFREAAAAVTEGAFLTLTQTDDGGMFALRLDGITPPALRPLVDVRDAVVTAWTTATTQERVMAQATELAGQISPLTGFDTLGLTPTEADGLTRTSFVEGTPPGFLTTVFGMEVGTVEVIDNGTSALIVRLDRTAPPDPDNAQTAAQLQAAGQAAAQGIAQDMFDAFAAAVQTRTDVQINQTTVDAVNAQLQ